jgi:tetratricopeptide (TPR) repeat protein
MAAAVGGNDTYGIARAAYQVAQVVSEAMGKPQEAEPWLAVADAAAGRIGPRPLLAASIAHSRAFVATKSGDPERALAALQESLALVRQVPGSERRQASLYNDLGIVFTDMGRYREAEEALKLAIEMKGTGYGPGHPWVATSLNSLGSVYWSQDQFDKALELHLAALEVLQKSYGSEHRMVAITMNNVATALNGLGRQQESDGYLREAIAIQERVLGWDHIELANSLINLAFRYRERGDLEEALAIYRRALPIVEKNLGPEHFMVGGTRHGTGVTLSRMGRHAEAAAQFERSFAIFHQLPVDVRFRAGASFELAKALFGAGQDRVRSRQLAGQALQEYRTEAARFPKEIAAVESWIAGHR